MSKEYNLSASFHLLPFLQRLTFEAETQKPNETFGKYLSAPRIKCLISCWYLFNVLKFVLRSRWNVRTRTNLRRLMRAAFIRVTVSGGVSCWLSAKLSATCLIASEVSLFLDVLNSARCGNLRVVVTSFGAFGTLHIVGIVLCTSLFLVTVFINMQSSICMPHNREFLCKYSVIFLSKLCVLLLKTNCLYLTAKQLNTWISLDNTIEAILPNKMNSVSHLLFPHSVDVCQSLQAYKRYFISYWKKWQVSAAYAYRPITIVSASDTDQSFLRIIIKL